MIMTMDVNKITRLMGLTIMQVIKNFKSNRMLRIFGRSNGILRIRDIHESTEEEWILGKGEKLSVGIFMWQEQQGSRHKRILGTLERISGYLVITRSTGNKSKNDRCKYLSIGVFRW